MRESVTYCGEYTAVKQEVRTVEAVSLRCRAWTCPDCKDGRRRRLTREGIAGHPDTFLTLTLRRTTTETPEQAATALARGWRLLRSRIVRQAARDPKKPQRRSVRRRAEPGSTRRRRTSARPIQLCSRTLPFLAVMERTKAGWPHLHLLIRSRWLDQAWLARQWHDITGSPIVHIQRLNSTDKSVAYCAKYCGKCEHKIGTAKRYWRSRDYILDKLPPSASLWLLKGRATREAHNIHHVAMMLAASGYDVAWTSDRHLLAHGRGPP